MPLDRLPPRACRSNLPFPPELYSDPKYTFSDVETDNEKDSFFDSPDADIELLPPTSASSPVSQLPRSSHTRKRSPFHIRRPRNAFIIFRSEFCDQQKGSEHGIETDHRHISRIAAHIWNNFPEDKKIVYKRRAEEEKAAHKAAYPNYRYAPVGRPRSVVKQRPNRSSNDETLRCRKVAELYIAGLKGGELNSAIKALDETITTEPSLPQYVSPPTQKRTRTRPRPRSAEKQIDVVTPSPSPPPSSSLPKMGVWDDRVGPLGVCAPSQNDIKPAKSRAPSPEQASTNEGEFNYLHDSSPFTMEFKDKKSIKSELTQDDICKPESRSTFSTDTDTTDLGLMDESSDVFSNLTLGQLFRATPEFPDSPNSGLSYFTALSVNDSDESGEVLNASTGTPFPTSNEGLFSDVQTREATAFKLEGEKIIDTHFGDDIFMYTGSRDMADFVQYLDL